MLINNLIRMYARYIISFIFLCFGWTNGYAQRVIMGAEQPDGYRAKLQLFAPFPGDSRNIDYKTLTVNGEPVQLAHMNDAGYGSFAFDGKPVHITLTTWEPIRNYNISPHSFNIKSRKSAHQLSFRLYEPRKLIIQVNDLSPLFLFAEIIENQPVDTNSNVLNMLDFMVDPGGEAVCTDQIQHAIDSTAGLNDHQGGILFFPAGKYLTGHLKMRDNVTLYLQAGALIQGTKNEEDYIEFPGVSRHLILFDKVRNASIRGRGAIDAAGTDLRTLYGIRHRVLLIQNCQHILIEGISLRNSGSWNTQIVNSDHINFNNVKILNDVNLGNTDGIDPDSSSDLIVDNCFIYAGDDAVVIKQTRSENTPYSERIRVEKCVIWTRKSALKIGTETRGDVFRNIIFENNDIVHADRGMAIYLDDGALVENIQFINNRFEHIGGDRNQMLIHMVISEGTGQGRIRDVLIKDNHAHEFSPNHSQIMGLDENHRISDLTIQNLIIKDTIRKNLRDARIEVNHFVEYEFK